MGIRGRRSRAVLLGITLALGCSSCVRQKKMSDADLHAMLQGAAQARMAMPGSQHPAMNQDGTRKTSTPYTGDPAVFDSPGREKRLKIDLVMKILGIGPGKSVADIGAGGGWFTVRAARKVGPNGLVYAEEISPAAIRFIEERAAKEKLGNVRTVLGTPNDPKLPENSVDAVLMLKMYHEIAQPVEVMRRVRVALRPGAMVGVIDRNGNGSGEDHGVPSEVVIREMGEAGFELANSYDFTKVDGEDYFLVFQAG